MLLNTQIKAHAKVIVVENIIFLFNTFYLKYGMWCISAAREVKGSTLNNAHIFYIGHGDQSVFFKLENIINVIVISFRFT